MPGWEVVTTARERSGRALSEIRLEPLEQEEARALVANLLEIESLAPATRDLILDKAEGNPFYVEEVIRMLIDHGAIEQDGGRWKATGAAQEVSIPDTLHGLILARIDRLADDARRILRLASCIDRQFPLPLLEDVARASGMADGIGTALARLEAANLLILASADPELEYRFSHALIADAAYETVLRQERREWHALIADAMLARYADREEELADRLARHFELAGDPDRAVDHLLVAAERALARNAMVDAVGLYAHARDLLADAPAGSEADDDLGHDPGDVDPSTSDRRRLRVIMGTLASGWEMLASKDAEEMLATGRALAGRLGDDSALSDILFWEVALRQAAGERPENSASLRAALEQMDALADVAGNDVQRAQALSRSGLYLWWTGDFERSLEVLERAGALFRKKGDVIGASMAETYIAADLASLGSFAEADRRMQESRALSETADALSKLDFHLAEAALAAIHGDFDTAIKFAGECFEASAEIGALACASVSGMVLGGSQMAIGELSDARESLQRRIEYATQGYMAPMRLRGRVLLAAADGGDGAMEDAEKDFRSALERYVAKSGPYGQAEARLARGMVLATHPAGDATQALDDLDAAAALFSSLGARPALARTYRAQGLALARAGRADEADVPLSQAATMAPEIGLMDGPWPGSVAELEAARAAGSPLRLVD